MDAWGGGGISCLTNQNLLPTPLPELEDVEEEAELGEEGLAEAPSRGRLSTGTV